MQKQPNILLFFTDMQRYDTIGALGNQIIKTPNLDRLVKEGTAFNSCYSPSPVCIPARCSMHYGLYPAKTGLAVNGAMMEHNEKSLADILNNCGYTTHAAGKVHFSPDKNALRGFNSRDTQEECCRDAESDNYTMWLRENNYDYFEPHGFRGEMYYIPQVSTLPAEAHPSQWVADRSMDFINSQRDKKQPWMLMSSYIHPHPPFCPPKPWHKLYRSPLMPLPNVPENSEALHTWINRKQNRYKYRDQGIDKNLMRNIKAFYYATISFVDYQIGRIIKNLEENGELDNTLIIFTSDHGEYLGDYNCFGKRSMHDVSSRIPLIVRYPERFTPGKMCETPVSLVDILPTLSNAAEADISDIDHDGHDLSMLADGKTDREYVYSQYGNGNNAIYMIVNKSWKYFYSAADNQEFLFDRIHDPLENRNIAGLRMRSDQKEQMKINLLKYLKANNVNDAWSEEDGILDWKKYSGIDETYLNDPDASLLIQDYEPDKWFLEGYSE